MGGDLVGIKFLEISPTPDPLPIFSISENVTTIRPVVHAGNLGAVLDVHHEALLILLLKLISHMCHYLRIHSYRPKPAAFITYHREPCQGFLSY